MNIVEHTATGKPTLRPSETQPGRVYRLITGSTAGNNGQLMFRTTSKLVNMRTGMQFGLADSGQKFVEVEGEFVVRS